jgi:hypothetical protein
MAYQSAKGEIMTYEVFRVDTGEIVFTTEDAGEAVTSFLAGAPGTLGIRKGQIATPPALDKEAI